MGDTKKFVHIVITIDDCAALDRKAKALDRSRSWAIRQAIREYCAILPENAPQEQTSGPFNATASNN